MLQLKPEIISDQAISEINSLGGPQLPTGVSMKTLKVIMENISVSEASGNRHHLNAALAFLR
ncbi:MAG: hypothetical protein AAGI66_09180 [Cyanobacteria bacterium P01_H01_bin.74]